MNYVYILKCSDDSLYTGWTTDPTERIKAHNAGTGAKYTRGRGPVTLVYLEKFDNKGDALSREAEIKKLPRKEKLSLISSIDSQTATLVSDINAAVSLKS